MKTAEELFKSLDGIGSYIIDGDYAMYQKYVSALPAGAVVLDVATGRGVSAMAMAMANLQVRVITVEDGSTMLYNKWAENEDDYKRKISGLCEERGITNLELVYEDFLKYNLNSIPPIDLFHVDDEDEEGKMLEHALPYIKVGGILLVRNYRRFKETADVLCKGFEDLDSGGLIKVIRKT